MKLIKDLKQGDKIYDIDFRKVRWYTYFCPHPHNENYHIIIDGGQEPIRIYGEKLQMILDQNFVSYDDALLELSNRMEESVKSIREDLKQKNHIKS